VNPKIYRMIMKRFYYIALLFFLFTAFISCDGQTKHKEQTTATSSPVKDKLVGGGCDGCELMYIGMPSNISSVDTCVDWNEQGQKLLVTGKVFKVDGKTPVLNVIVYYYHTDNTGHYSKRNDKPANQTVHGHIRGWVKTDAGGNYSIYTTRPAPYPGNSIPAHIHIVIKEPALNEYYIDELVFDDDKILTEAKRKALENRGGSGILKVSTANGLQVAEHNIILGLNIRNYPAND
jgi:protocatechuate 3,4-dioxygenase beta subunit